MRGVNAAGIYHVKSAAIPLRFTEETVTRGAGRIVDDRHAFADHAVEERAFSDVGYADEGNDWFGHIIISLSAIGRAE